MGAALSRATQIRRGIVRMFNNRKPDGAPAPATGAEAERSALHASAVPRGAHSAAYKGDSSAHSVVDECLTMKGDLESEGDILVKGKVIGNIRCKLLIIEVDALVEGGVEAEEVVVRGNTKGTLQADRVKLENTANVDSEIYHLTFSAEEGARIKGSLRSKDELIEGPTRAGEGKESARTKVGGRSKEQPLNGHTEAAESSA
jgi:cytoskeletal protein CcmA (bactofilin family)